MLAATILCRFIKDSILICYITIRASVELCGQKPAISDILKVTLEHTAAYSKLLHKIVWTDDLCRRDPIIYLKLSGHF